MLPNYYTRGLFNLFLKENGEVWVMGKNDYGQCGFDGKEIDFFENPTLLMTDKNIISVCCGIRHSFILTSKKIIKKIKIKLK